MTVDLENINRAVTQAYGSIHEPNYAFVSRALQRNEHANILDNLSSADFDIVDDTDPNTDVSRVFVLTRGDVVLSVRLSFVGPFAAVSLDPSSSLPEAATAVAGVRMVCWQKT